MGAIEEAKTVIRAHEEFSSAGDLDGILSNMDEDVVFLVPDSPLVEGREAVRSLYESLFAMGSWEFGHDYSAATEVGDLVLLHGIARGSLTPEGQEAAPFANNFMITMRRAADGRYRTWRVAFAPGGE